MRENQSQQINRAYYARGRQNRLPRTINESTNERNFAEEDTNGGINRQNDHDQTQQSSQPTLQRFHSEADVRTERRPDFHGDYTAVEIDFDNSTDDHVNTLTAGLGSTWTIADP